MQVPLISAAKHSRQVDVFEAIRCASVDRKVRAQKHKKEMLRYLVLVIALVAIIILMSIALYYTRGNSVSIEHVSSLTSRLILRA
jgi:hypothetical protein